MTRNNSITGKEVRTLRNSLNLSQSEFGHLVGVEPTKVKEWEETGGEFQIGGIPQTERLNNLYVVLSNDKTRKPFVQHFEEIDSPSPEYLSMLGTAGLVSVATLASSEDDAMRQSVGNRVVSMIQNSITS